DYEPEPWTPVDSAAWLKAMAWDLRTNIEDETTRALLTQRLDDDAIEDLYPEYPFDEHPVILAEDRDGCGLADANIPDPSRIADANTPDPARHAAADHRAGQQASAEPSETAPLVQAEPVVEVVEEVDAVLPSVGEGTGSNSSGVSGEHTEGGLHLLANDPHLG